MAWDLEFKNGDLTGGIATGDDEVIQRIRTRLFRERGVWFLNTAGMPWHQDGKGILGATLRDKSTVDLLIRKRIMETEGGVRVVKLNTLFSIGSRTYSIYMQVLLRSGNILEDTLIIGLEDENGV